MHKARHKAPLCAFQLSKMSNAKSAELPRNKLTFFDKLNIGINLLPLRKCT